MRARRAEYDSDEFRDRWHSNEPLRCIAEWLGVSITAVWLAGTRRYPARSWIGWEK